jgi:hypothetical protein
MAHKGEPQKSLSTAANAVFFVGAISLFAGLIAGFFDVQFLKSLRLGWSSVLFGALFLALGYYTRRRSATALWIAVGIYTLDAVLFIVQMITMNALSGSGGLVFRIAMIWLMARGIIAIRELNTSPMTARQPAENASLQSAGKGGAVSAQSLAMPVLASGPKPVSFVAHPTSAIQPEIGKREMLSKALTPEILNLRFVAYRCEIAIDHFKAIYQNATQREVKWFEIGSLVIRQFPFQQPWDGKLLLDVVPISAGREKIQPIRILSSTYVNYGFLPQGQSASTKENIRRLSNFILSQNRSIFIDPGTDYFVHAGQPPVRFLSMLQFSEYDASYK